MGPPTKRPLGLKKQLIIIMILNIIKKLQLENTHIHAFFMGNLCISEFPPKTRVKIFTK